MTTVQPNETRDSTGPVPSNMLQDREVALHRPASWWPSSSRRGRSSRQHGLLLLGPAQVGSGRRMTVAPTGPTYRTGIFKTAAVGALAVADGDHNVVYAGMGEACIRGDVSHGDGVYRSTDAGKTWAHLGLEDTRYISRIRVHPTNPDLVYVAALGHAYGRNEERGVFRSKTAGATGRRSFTGTIGPGQSTSPSTPTIRG